MKSAIAATLITASLILSAPAFASKELATKNNCMACHAVDTKGAVGPGFKDIGKKYTAKDEKVLAERIIKGNGPNGSGWQKAGQASMPFMYPNASVTPENATILAKWILGGAK